MNSKAGAMHSSEFRKLSNKFAATALPPEETNENDGTGSELSQAEEDAVNAAIAAFTASSSA